MIKLNFFKRLKKIFKGEKVSFEFKNIRVKDIENEINLKAKGESDGKNNLPSEHSEVFSITENEAITKYDERRHDAVSDAANYLDPIKNKILGHEAKITVKKSPNEKTNTIITYPVMYGRVGGNSVWREREIRE